MSNRNNNRPKRYEPEQENRFPRCNNRKGGSNNRCDINSDARRRNTEKTNQQFDRNREYGRPDEHPGHKASKATSSGGDNQDLQFDLNKNKPDLCRKLGSNKQLLTKLTDNDPNKPKPTRCL